MDKSSRSYNIGWLLGPCPYGVSGFGQTKQLFVVSEGRNAQYFHWEENCLHKKMFHFFWSINCTLGGFPWKVFETSHSNWQDKCSYYLNLELLSWHFLLNRLVRYEKTHWRLFVAGVSQSNRQQRLLNVGSLDSLLSGAMQIMKPR